MVNTRRIHMSHENKNTFLQLFCLIAVVDLATVTPHFVAVSMLISMVQKFQAELNIVCLNLSTSSRNDIIYGVCNLQWNNFSALYHGWKTHKLQNNLFL